MTKKRKIVIGSALGVLIFGMAGIAIASGGEKGTLVRTEVVEQRDLTSIVSASGRIEPKHKVDISADISGRVIALAVEEGDWVDRGDLLLRIDPTSYQAQVRRAEASVAQAQAQSAQARANWLQARSALERAERLADGPDLISAEALEQARTQMAINEAQMEAARYRVAESQAMLAEARELLRKTTIAAPMSGRVTRLNIREGETAIIGTMNNPGSLLLTIADLSAMEARVKVDETDVPRIALGNAATVRIDAFPNQTFTGQVTRIGNSALQGSGSTGAASSQNQSVDFEVVITLDAPPQELRPDLSATGEIVTASRQKAMAIPILALTIREQDADSDVADAPGTSALRPGDDGKREVEGVFVVEDGKVRFVPVEVGIVGDRYFEVLGGLTGGETIVAGSYQAIRDLQDGGTVRVPEAKNGTHRAAGGNGPATDR